MQFWYLQFVYTISSNIKLRVLVADKLYSGVGEGAPLRGVSPDMWIKTTGLSMSTVAIIMIRKHERECVMLQMQ